MLHLLRGNSGAVITDVKKTAPFRAVHTVSAQFVNANPRNYLRLEGTFFIVDQSNPDNGGRCDRIRIRQKSICRWKGDNTVYVTLRIDQASRGFIIVFPPGNFCEPPKVISTVIILWTIEQHP
ncbi:hypothetical protein B0H34DRAFT_383016 [Crassisporium funariophilum]|nr:hypothetical protein B0H34DRAFT_383016 [Crassisporium funariophilum]